MWTDGSCLHPLDDLLRTVAWAVVRLEAYDFVTAAAAHVPGRQTVGRAELCALVWVSLSPSATHAVTDAKYLHDCLVRHLHGEMPAALLQGTNGDLWRVLLRGVPTTWVKAHFTTQKTSDRGIPEFDRAGNAAADEAAKAKAAAALPSPPVVARRERSVQAFGRLQALQAVVQEAALAATRTELRVWLLRWQQRWRPQRQRKRRLPGVALAAQSMGTCPPPGIHHLCRPDPGVGQPVESASAILSCRCCTVVARCVCAWPAFAMSICQGKAGHQQLKRLAGPHNMVRRPAGWYC